MNTFEEAMVGTVTAMWDSLLGSPIHTRNGTVDFAPAEPMLVGSIHITGPRGGVVTLNCSETLARSIASTILQLPEGSVGMGDAEDALGELTNIMGGNLKVMLDGEHHLSLPTVVEGRDFRARFIGTELEAQVEFDCSGRPLTASFYRDGARATA